MLGPTSHYFYSQRLKLHYVDWGNPEKPPLLLIHGGRDHARNWDWVAQDLRRDFHIIAPDLRGHGDSQWAVGGSYAMVDYTLDVAQLLNAVDVKDITIIGHSLGGSISLQYSGTYADRVKKVVAIEGLGPPPELLRQQPPAHVRMRVWISEMKALSRRHPHRYANLDEAVARMQDANPRLTAEQARHLTVHGSIATRTAPTCGSSTTTCAPPRRISSTCRRRTRSGPRSPARCCCCAGTESWASDPQIDGRAKAFRDYTFHNIEGAGHWVHHDQLAIFLGHVREFLGV